MKILLAIDSFKESLSSEEAARAFAKGFKKGFPKATFETLLVADGGEGFTEALIMNGKGRRITTLACDPLFRKIHAVWGMLQDGTAVLETAAVAGLMQLSPKERNPKETTTYGLGLLLKAALDKKCRSVILGLGGSATSDGGGGMLQALGATFYDRKGIRIPTPFRGKHLKEVASVDLCGLDSRLAETTLTAACDVDNPLFGPSGAAFVYAPQKGASPAMVRELDQGLNHYASMVKRAAPLANPSFPGSGAAGGLGFALKGVLKASLVSGIDLMLSAAQFSKRLSGVDLVVTGEGRMDGQTANNKAPYGIARLARKRSVPVLAVCGSRSLEAAQLYKAGFCGIYSIVPGPTSLDTALREAATNLEQLAEALGRTYFQARRLR